MNKKIIVLTATLFIPAMAFAHGAREVLIGLGIYSLLLLPFALLILKWLNKYIAVRNKIVRFILRVIVLLFIEIILLFLLIAIFRAFG